MKRFLEFLIFKPNTDEKPNANSVSFSSLKTTLVDLFTAKKEDKEKKDETDKTAPEPNKTNNSKFTIVSNPAPGYTDGARMRQVHGIIQIRVTFNENGFIPKIDVVKSLPEGLLRQAIFAALRIKFLPEEKEEKLISTTKTIEYSFAIY
jgi:outer membrane biosynthesis protein TonB